MKTKDIFAIGITCALIFVIGITLFNDQDVRTRNIRVNDTITAVKKLSPDENKSGKPCYMITYNNSNSFSEICQNKIPKVGDIKYSYYKKHNSGIVMIIFATILISFCGMVFCFIEYSSKY